MAALCMSGARDRLDRCPGSIALHEAEDGLLARVRVPGGRLTAMQMSALTRAAALGNGLVDITSRANLQVRGLASDAGDELADLLWQGGLLPSLAHDRARNVLASPTAGRHPAAVAATDPTVDEIDALLCANVSLASLPGRFLFAVDDGSGLALDQPADVTLVAQGANTFELGLGGWCAGAGGARDAIAAAVAFVSLARGRAWRISELADGPAAVARALGRTLTRRPVGQAVAQLAPGRLQQRDGRWAVTALVPLGRLDGDMLDALGPEVRVGAGRTLTLADVESPGAAERRLASLGLVLEPGSGWVGLTACAGIGRCRKALFDVRAAAASRAGVRGPDSLAEHWAACERRCGERPYQLVAVAALAGGGLSVRAGDNERAAHDLRDALAVLT
jgi:precorrin-3B synthase